MRGKRRRYPASGGELVPLVFEAGGRPADEAVAFVRSWAAGVDEADALQMGNVEMFLSAIG